ncbi:proton-conducting transporter transmembrane domain-containing protein [Mycolicibacterium rhodesiae]|uniref:NADH dehydrogenase n=1 Tax=Mycolicibacterium rhodesiae TaxID=36814 RepID=A0A1X0IU10_MYCRH|nr:proton-conducting transporter membrane subunit [Mycolicibacterium rhodesiae]MCV7346021.1 NADH-quinone oxidoreductase subunit L [Mycolicibacterium rhodesiae]ORB52318.1 NADH dehydrogenase [Mycolicibacterium rhodesiae]
MSALLLWLLVATPAAVGVVLLISRRDDRSVNVISLATALGCAGVSVVVAVARPSVQVAFMAGAPFGLRVDALAGTVLLVVTIVTLLVLIFSAGNIREARGRFHGLMLVFAAAAILTVTAATLPALLLGWEVMGAASYALIGFWWREQYRVSDGLTAFITTRTADLGLYLAAGAALAGGAGMALSSFSDARGGWRDVLAFGVLVAALGKAAQLPFSFWLSRAMSGPSPVSALLHSAAMVAMGGFLLLRTQPLLAATGWAATAAAWAGVLTAVVLGAVAVAQGDIKQLLAASTAAQLGFVVLAAGVAAVGGGAAHLVAHAATKAGLFLTAGVWLSLLGTQRLDDLHGVARRWRVVGWSATVAALTLAGIAPLSLWATKDAVLTAAAQHSPALYGLGLLASGLSAAYAAKMVAVIWARPSTDLTAPAQAAPPPGVPRRLTGLEQAPLVVLAAGAVGSGVLALPPLGSILARAVNGDQPSTHPGVAALIASAALALVVVAAVARWGVLEPRWAASWLGLQRAAHLLVVAPTIAAARVAARFDDRVLDRAVDATAIAVLRAARRAAQTDNGVDAAVEAVAARMGRFGELARRPQTGQLHQYYLAAVVLLVAGFVLLVTVR